MKAEVMIANKADKRYEWYDLFEFDESEAEEQLNPDQKDECELVAVKFRGDFEELFTSAYGDEASASEIEELKDSLSKLEYAEQGDEAYDAFAAIAEHQGWWNLKYALKIFANGSYRYLPKVTNDEEYGRYLYDNDMIEIPEKLVPHFNFESYGRDARLEEGGYHSETGYIVVF